MKWFAYSDNRRWIHNHKDFYCGNKCNLCWFFFLKGLVSNTPITIPGLSKNKCVRHPCKSIIYATWFVSRPIFVGWPVGKTTGDIPLNSPTKLKFLDLSLRVLPLEFQTPLKTSFEVGISFLYTARNRTISFTGKEEFI